MGLTLAARDPVRPLVAGLVLLIAYGTWSRKRVHGDVAWFEERTERVAPALALMCGAVVAVIGVLRGTYAASGADSYGYLSQADLWVRGSLVQPEPLAARFTWTNVDGIFSPLGYRPGIVPHTIVPIYSPGLPLLMAGARLVIGRCGPFLVVPICAFLLVWLTFSLGRQVLSQRGAVAAALLVASSPVVILLTVWPMSDVPVAAAWTLALVLILRGGAGWLLAAGAAAGMTIVIRPNLVLLTAIPVAALWFASGVSIRERIERILMFAPGVLAAIAFIAILNHHLYGSPLRSGYDALEQLFSWANVPFNAHRYAERFALTATPAILLAIVPLVAPVFRATGHPGVSARILLYGTTAATLVLYLPYERFPEWWYLRFLLPLYPALYVAFCGGGSWVVSKLPRHYGLLLGVLGVTALAAFGVDRSIAFGTFGMNRYEGRYVAVGRWIQAHLPPNAIVVSKQHSGSVRYYAGVPTIRYDRIEAMHAVIEDLVRAGYHPYLLLENWERPEFTNRFLGVGFERLSWQPLARMREPEPLALYDLLNRASKEPPIEIPEVQSRCEASRYDPFSTQ